MIGLKQTSVQTFTISATKFYGSKNGTASIRSISVLLP